MPAPERLTLSPPNAGVVVTDPTAFGSTGNPIETTVGSILATVSGTGDFAVVETDDILVDYVRNTSGDIYLTRLRQGAINDLSGGDTAADFIAANRNGHPHSTG